MIRTHEIPRDGWGAYFDGIRRHAHVHTVRVEVASSQLGGQHLAQSLPLQDIELEAHDTVSVTVGREGEEFTHRVPEARRILVAEDAEGEPTCVDIESGEEGKTLLFFSPPDDAYGLP
jgi:hypothetical protein